MAPIQTGNPVIPQAHQEGPALACAPTQDLTAHNVTAARQTLTQLIDDHQPTDLILDLTHVGFMDSAGLATLVLLKKQLPPNGRLILQHAAAPVRGIIGIANLDKLFDLTPLPPEDPRKICPA